jgi:hypothetical protein
MLIHKEIIWSKGILLLLETLQRSGMDVFPILASLCPRLSGIINTSTARRWSGTALDSAVNACESSLDTIVKMTIRVDTRMEAY